MNISKLRKHKIYVTGAVLKAYKEVVKNADRIIQDMIDRKLDPADIRAALNCPPVKSSKTAPAGKDAPFIEVHRYLNPHKNRAI